MIILFIVLTVLEWLIGYSLYTYNMPLSHVGYEFDVLPALVILFLAVTHNTFWAVYCIVNEKLVKDEIRV